MNNGFSGHAINLFFDPALQQQFTQLLQKLACEKIASFLVEIGAKPHISLGLFEKDVDIKALTGITEQLAGSTSPIPLRFPSIAGFSLQQKMIFMPPSPTTQLLQLHAKLHELLNKRRIPTRENYMPGNWIPHCTVAYDVEIQNYKQAFWLCSAQQLPFTGHAVKIGLSSYLPVREIASYNLR